MKDFKNNQPDGDSVTWEEVKRRTLKPLDAWWIVLVLDRITMPVVYLYLKLGVKMTPNQITFISIFVGIAAAWSLSQGHWLLGGVLYQVFSILDCLDGRVARFRGISSTFGAWFDGAVNYLIYSLCVAGIALSDLTNFWLVGGCLALLAMRANAVDINNILKRPVDGSWSHFVAPKDSLLTKWRLLPLGSFPDKHAVLFLIAPVAGFVTVGVLINVILELILLIAKVWKLVSQLNVADKSEANER